MHLYLQKTEHKRQSNRQNCTECMLTECVLQTGVYLSLMLNTKCVFNSKTRYLRSGQMRVAVSYDTSQCSHSNYVSVWASWHSGTWSGHSLNHLMNWIHCTLLPLFWKCSNQCMN